MKAREKSKEKIRVVKTIKKDKKYSFDDGLMALGAHLSY